jgi:hypothetical protein
MIIHASHLHLLQARQNRLVLVLELCISTVVDLLLCLIPIASQLYVGNQMIV